MTQEKIVIVKDGQIFEVPFNPHFEKRHGKGSWVRLCSLLAQNCNSFTAIGHRFGISRERVRQLSRDYVAPYIDEKTGHERRRMCALTRVHIKKEFSPAVLGVWRTARREDIRVAPINSLYNQGNVYTLQEALELNDTLCCIHAADAVTATGARLGIAHFFFKNRKRSDRFHFSIFVITNPVDHWSSWVYYVIPRENIPEGVTSIYLPFWERRSYPRRTYDWTRFRDAWHLIPPVVQEPMSNL